MRSYSIFALVAVALFAVGSNACCQDAWGNNDACPNIDCQGGLEWPPTCQYENDW